MASTVDRRAYMRDYMRVRNGVEPHPCEQCRRVEVWGKHKFCGVACRNAARNLRRAAKTWRAHLEPRECPVCKERFSGPPNRKSCEGRCANRLALVRKYGMEYSDYEALLARQDGACAACGLPLGDKTPRIDHCHESGRVRGLLHDTCNAGIGQAHDDPEKLLGWAAYLCRDQFDLRDLCLR